jgi:diguanylate cyclase (GGDEF)-like protein
MTGLKNRRAYSEKLQQLSKQLPPVCCVIMIDVNGLKQTNDTLGHNAGDELIIGTADCIREAFPDTEDTFRLGGDEFCVILTERETYAKERLAVLFQRTAKKTGEYINGISIACGMSSDRDSLDIEEIAKIADERMYRAKKTYYMNREHDRRHEEQT